MDEVRGKSAISLPGDSGAPDKREGTCATPRTSGGKGDNDFSSFRARARATLMTNYTDPDPTGRTSSTLRDMNSDPLGRTSSTLRDESTVHQRPPIQSSDMNEFTIVGNDVEALFPSLKDFESARVAREAIDTSDLKFENIDVVAALKYLRVTGGDDHVREIGLANVAPRWLGKRPDLITIGGDAMKEDASWTKLRRNLNEHEIRLVVSRVIETAVLICMSTHVYSSGPDLYIQCAGGPIGMRFTASLANIVMKQWDKAWVKLLKRENLKFDLFLRYVDDCRLFMPSINPG